LFRSYLHICSIFFAKQSTVFVPFETQENMCLFGTWLDLPVFQVFTFGLNGCVCSWELGQCTHVWWGGWGTTIRQYTYIRQV